MTKVKPAGIKLKTAPVAGALKAYFDRVNRIEDDAEAVRDASKDLITEIKSAGYSAKAIKRLVKESRRKTDEQLEADLEMYRTLLAMPGATYRSVADTAKVPRSTLHRLVPRKQNGTKPEDGDDGITAHIPDGVVIEATDTRPENAATVGLSAGASETIHPTPTVLGDAPQPEHHSTDASADEDAGLPDLSRADAAPSVGEVYCPKRGGATCETPNACAVACRYDNDAIHPNREAPAPRSVDAVAEPKAERVASPIEDIPLFLRRTREQANA